jgi:hypothetical protein
VKSLESHMYWDTLRPRLRHLEVPKSGSVLYFKICNGLSERLNTSVYALCRTLWGVR